MKIYPVVAGSAHLVGRYFELKVKLGHDPSFDEYVDEYFAQDIGQAILDLGEPWRDVVVAECARILERFSGDFTQDAIYMRLSVHGVRKIKELPDGVHPTPTVREACFPYEGLYDLLTGPYQVRLDTELGGTLKSRLRASAETMLNI